MKNSTTPLETSPDTLVDKNKLARRVGIGVGLGAVSVGAVIAQYSGASHDMLQLPLPTEITHGMEAVSNSLAHPAVGYLGALVAVWAADRMKRKPNIIPTAIVGGTIANFSVETVQDVFFTGLRNSGITETSSHFWEQAQWGESIKDYAFALGGVAIYLLSEKIGSAVARKKQV